MRSRYIWVVRGFTGDIIAGFTVKRELERWLESFGLGLDIYRIDGHTQTVVSIDRESLNPVDPNAPRDEEHGCGPSTTQEGGWLCMPWLPCRKAGGCLLGEVEL